MEKGAVASNGLSSWDKKSSSNSDDVAHSMKMHSTEAFLSKSFTAGGIHKAVDNPDRPFDGGGGAGGGGASAGPTAGSNIGGANEVVLGNINHHHRGDVSSNSCGAAGIFAEGNTHLLQPFDMFASPAAYSTTPYRFPGGMAAGVGFPFTSAQWRELERQAMIYKYMMCSVPVPPELLFPLTKSFPAQAVDSSASPLYNVRYSRNGDPEPGRCKRTDGKKWRCSRDVAPHQKYCERHLHRGRPRSRKPVEVKSSGESHKKTRPVSLTTPTIAAAAASHQVAAANDPPHLMLFNSKTDVSISANRDLGLMMEAGMVNVNGDEQRWQHLMGTNMEFGSEGSSSIYGSSHLFDQDYVEQQHPLNAFTYSNVAEAPAGFIDAWSIDNLNSSSSNGNGESTNQGSLSPNSLNLSMAMAVGNILDEGMGKVQLGGSVECYNEHSSKNSTWLGPLSWQPFAQGGPLAEALHPGSAYPASPHDSISTPPTTVSSPSGVLQRTFFSHSDSSVCNSPTFAAHAEVAFPRFNQID